MMLNKSNGKREIYIYIFLDDRHELSKNPFFSTRVIDINMDFIKPNCLFSMWKFVSENLELLRIQTY